MVLIAIWPVQKSENAVHLTGHKDSGTKQILREKWRPAGTGFEGSKFRDFSVPPGHMACMRVFKLLACGARGPGFDSRPRHLNFQRLVISCYQVEIWLKDR